MSKRHEQLLFRYSSALERGDFEMVAEVLREAERDPDLETMLLELNEAYAAEQSERFNHMNSKEMMGMIAPLYQNRTPERVKPYNLPMIAALAIVTLVGILLATRLSPPTNWNTGQNGSPEAIAMQIDPAECAPSEADPGRIQLYSRPSKESRYAYDAFSTLYIPQSSLTLLDSVEVDGETWYFVRIQYIFDEDMQGWMTAEEYNRNVRCAPLVNAELMTQVAMNATLTGTPTPFDAELMMSATAIVAQATALQATALPPTVVPPGEIPPTVNFRYPFYVRTPPSITMSSDDIQPVVVPPDAQGLATFTPTPAIHVPDATALPPTVVQPAVEVGANMNNLQVICAALSIGALNIYTAPLLQSRVIYEVPAHSTLDILAYSDEDDGRWYVVGYWAAADVYVTGMVAPDVLTLDEGCEDVSSIVTLVPTVVPLAQADLLPTVPPADNIRIPAYPIYIVQEGDTLLSILSQFNLSAAWLDQLVFINNLPDETAELPETLLIPVPSGMQLLTCVVDEGETVDLRVEPGADASSILTLPAGEVFQVIDEYETASGTWYMAAWQAGGAPLRSGWVDVEAISQRSDCRRFAALFETSYSLPIFDPANYPYGIVECFVVTEKVMSSYFPPALDAEIVTDIPAGTQLQVVALEVNDAGLWYTVLYYRHVNPVGSQYMSYVPAADLVLPASCNADEVIAAAEAEATLPAPTLIPARGNFYGGFTNCIAMTNRATLVTLGSTRDSELLTELPSGLQLEVTGGTEESDGMWYLVNYLTEYGTVMSGFVSGGDVTVAGDCPATLGEIESLTSTPMPTALPLTVTPMPVH